MKKRRKPVGLHPFQKQAIRAKWNSEAVKAQIHALMGDDIEKLLAFGSVLFFVASACSIHLGWTGDEPDMRIVRASVNALDDLATRRTITDADRGALNGGLLAAHRIIEVTPVEVVTEAAILYDRHSLEWEKAKKHD
jgi:hypothetical protein